MAGEGFLKERKKELKRQAIALKQIDIGEMKRQFLRTMDDPEPPEKEGPTVDDIKGYTGWLVSDTAGQTRIMVLDLATFEEACRLNSGRGYVFGRSIDYYERKTAAEVLQEEGTMRFAVVAETLLRSNKEFRQGSGIRLDVMTQAVMDSFWRIITKMDEQRDELNAIGEGLGAAIIVAESVTEMYTKAAQIEVERMKAAKEEKKSAAYAQRERQFRDLTEENRTLRGEVAKLENALGETGILALQDRVTEVERLVTQRGAESARMAAEAANAQKRANNALQRAEIAEDKVEQLKDELGHVRHKLGDLKMHNDFLKELLSDVNRGVIDQRRIERALKGRKE